MTVEFWLNKNMNLTSENKNRPALLQAVTTAKVVVKIPSFKGNCPLLLVVKGESWPDATPAQCLIASKAEEHCTNPLAACNESSLSTGLVQASALIEGDLWPDVSPTGHGGIRTHIIHVAIEPNPEAQWLVLDIARTALLPAYCRPTSSRCVSTFHAAQIIVKKRPPMKMGEWRVDPLRPSRISWRLPEALEVAADCAGQGGEIPRNLVVWLCIVIIANDHYAIFAWVVPASAICFSTLELMPIYRKAFYSRVTHSATTHMACNIFTVHGGVIHD